MIPAADYLNQNPLLQTDLSSDIWHHTIQGYKNEILAVISLIAFIALATLAIGITAFYAPESIAVVTVLIGLSLKAIHSSCFHPCQEAARKHWTALKLENRVAELLAIPNLDFDEAAFRASVGANPKHLPSLPAEKTLTHAYARYIALQERNNDRLTQIREQFYAKALFRPVDNKPKNYKALLEAQMNCTTEAEYFSYEVAIDTQHSVWTRIEDEYLKDRIQQIFCTYVMDHPVRRGSYDDVGFPCLQQDLSKRENDRKRRKIDTFYRFFDHTRKPTDYCITRSQIYDAHQRVSLLIAAFLNNEDVGDQRAKLEALIPADARETLVLPATDFHLLYLNPTFTPLVENLVNQHFQKIFLDHDPHRKRD